MSQIHHYGMDDDDLGEVVWRPLQDGLRQMRTKRAMWLASVTPKQCSFGS